MSRPRLFIISTTEGRPVADAVTQELALDCDVVQWTTVSKPSAYLMDTVQRAIGDTDFVIVVMTPDMKSTARGRMFYSARENVVLELGIAIGVLGHDRTFMLLSDAHRMTPPTDCDGLVYTTYQSARISNEGRAAVGPACISIREVIGRLGPRPRSHGSFLTLLAPHTSPPLRAKAFEGSWLSSFAFEAARSDGAFHGVQFGVERLEHATGARLVGGNIHVGSTGKRYEHRTELVLAGHQLVGTWTNVNSAHFGTMLLHARRGGDVLDGMHLGQAADNRVTTGAWRWVRIGGQIPRQFLSRGEFRSGVTLREFDRLAAVMNDAIREDRPVSWDSCLHLQGST